MKRLIFCLALFSLMFTSAIASDVGNKEPLTPKGGFILVEQVYQVMPVVSIPVSFETTPVVINFKVGDVVDTGDMNIGILFKPDVFVLIDPGRCYNLKMGTMGTLTTLNNKPITQQNGNSCTNRQTTRHV